MKYANSLEQHNPIHLCTSLSGRQKSHFTVPHFRIGTLRSIFWMQLAWSPELTPRNWTLITPCPCGRCHSGRKNIGIAWFELAWGVQVLTSLSRFQRGLVSSPAQKCPLHHPNALQSNCPFCPHLSLLIFMLIHCLFPHENVKSIRAPHSPRPGIPQCEKMYILSV